MGVFLCHQQFPAFAPRIVPNALRSGTKDAIRHAPPDPVHVEELSSGPDQHMVTDTGDGGVVGAGRQEVAMDSVHPPSQPVTQHDLACVRSVSSAAHGRGVQDMDKTMPPIVLSFVNSSSRGRACSRVDTASSTAVPVNADK